MSDSWEKGYAFERWFVDHFYASTPEGDKDFALVCKHLQCTTDGRVRWSYRAERSAMARACSEGEEVLLLLAVDGEDGLTRKVFLCPYDALTGKPRKMAVSEFDKLAHDAKSLCPALRESGF